MSNKPKSPNAADLDDSAQRLLRMIVSGCLKAQGLPATRRNIDAAIELIEAGFAVIKSDGDTHWLEAI